MNLPTARIINETDNPFDYMTQAEYNQFVCGIYHNRIPSEAEIEYFREQEERKKVYEKLY